MKSKITNQHINITTVIDEIEKFQEKIHMSSIAAIALMEIGIAPKSNMAKEKAMLTHEISHAIKNILEA
ncbi:hypothetical protein [Streptococcus pseudoporcinus]|uniref:hypothetical protein n=1 Tax=Streptococcus pseudoporcinus TaxID=361101 RepID=UPI001166708B|nr:hypothetical protein [Streptococcus pseudoporcinus]VUC64667.1 Uncharacterised protein [Streptococcus pseudoporcinus]